MKIKTKSSFSFDQPLQGWGAPPAPWGVADTDSECVEGTQYMPHPLWGILGNL